MQNERRKTSAPAFQSGPVTSPFTLGRRLAYFGVVFPFLTGLVVLVGWYLGWARLITIGLGFTAMQPNTAAGLMLAAISLALLLRETTPRIVAGKSFAALVFALGLLTTVEYVFGADFRIDSLLIGVPASETSTAFPTRMSPFSAFCFLSAGVGLFFLTGRTRRATALSEFPVFAAMLTALLGLMGHAYGATAFYRIGNFNSMALHTAFAFLVLGSGILAARPERGLGSLLTRGTSGSLLARRVLPAAISVPLVLGWLRVKAEQAGYFELPFGTALLVTALVVIFAALIWRTAVALDRADCARRQTEDALRDSEGRYRSLFDSIDEGFCVIEVLLDEQRTPVDYRFLEINPAFERQSGLVGAVGKRMRELIPLHDAHWFETYGRIALTGEVIRFENYSASLERWFDVQASRVGQPEERKVAVLFTNITDRKRAEAARQRLAAIVEFSEDAIVSKDLNGIITTWNAGAERLLGYSEDEAVGQPVTMLIPADRVGEEVRILDGIRRSETFRNFETVRRHKSGMLIEVSLTISPIKDVDGRVGGASKILRDISGRKRNERELAEKARLLDLSNDAIIARNLDGNITVWNRGAEKYYGWKAEEVLGQHMHTLLQTELPEPMEEILEELYREKSYAAEVVQTSRDGRRIPLLCRWALDEEKGSILTSYTDITDRLQAQRELTEKARLLDLTNDAVIVRDTADRITFWNRGAEKLFGWTREEALGRGLHDLLQTEFPRPIEEIKAELRQHGKFAGEVTQVARDGHRVPSLCRWVLDRETASILTSYTDLTALRRAEDALRAAEKQAQVELQRHADSLELTVAQRTATLREIIGELEAFSYSLSHDMRAPLRAIQGFAEMAREECGGKADLFLGKVINAAVRMDRMIQDVLSYTRISRQEISLERIEVERLVQDLIAERLELQPPRAEIVVQTPLLPMRGHEASLTQCLTNLLGNAVKFVPRGATPRVRIGSEIFGDSVRLWIEDNGIGIETEAQQKLFAMFYRANAEKSYEGTGIGLAIVRKAVERMGGTVGVESEAGRGSRFWVQLPRAG